MSRPPPERSGMRDTLIQVQVLLTQAVRYSGQSDNGWGLCNQRLFELDKAINNLSLTEEIRLIGDNVSNDEIFSLVNTGLPELLQEIHNQLHDNPTLRPLENFLGNCSDVLRYFTFSTTTAVALILQLRSLAESRQHERTNPWTRSNEARTSLREFVRGRPIWPTTIQLTQGFDNLRSELLLPATYGVWTEGIKILHKLESNWRETGYGSLSDKDSAMFCLRHAMFWASTCESALYDIEHGDGASSIGNSRLLQATILKVKFILSAMKSIWLLDQLEVSSAFAWLPRKIRDLCPMLLHNLAKNIEHFFLIREVPPSLVDVNRFGDFSMKFPVDTVEKASKETETTRQVSESSVGHRAGIPAVNGFQGQLLSNTSQTNAFQPDFRIRNDLEGLQVAVVEHSSCLPLPEPVLQPQASALTSSLGSPNEVEMLNLECSNPANMRNGFLNGVYSLDTMPPFNTGYLKSHVRIYKTFADTDSYLRICTFRDGAPFHEVKALLSCVEFVPSYTFLDDEEHYHPFFLRSAGLPLGLSYSIRCLDELSKPVFDDLYGLQGALIGSRFEVQYPIRSMLLHRKGNPTAERLRPARMQIWTDSKVPTTNDDNRASSSPARKGGPTSPRHREIPFDTSDEDIEATKLYIFSQHCIYVLFVSDRVIPTKQPNSRKLFSTSPSTTLFLTPNKSKGIHSLRVRVIEGSARSPAGIPLDQANLHFSDQDTPNFIEFQSLQLEFPSDQILSECFADYCDFLNEWKGRRKRAETFKEHERKVRLHWTSKFTKGNRPASTVM